MPWLSWNHFRLKVCHQMFRFQTSFSRSLVFFASLYGTDRELLIPFSFPNVSDYFPIISKNNGRRPKVFCSFYRIFRIVGTVNGLKCRGIFGVAMALILRTGRKGYLSNLFARRQSFCRRATKIFPHKNNPVHSPPSLLYGSSTHPSQAFPSVGCLKTYREILITSDFLIAEYFRRDLQIAGMNQALDDLTTHENVNVKKRALIILTRIKAQKIAQQE